MSLSLSHDNQLRPQRRLGLLRNSYPDHVIGSSRNVHDVRQCCSAFARNLRSSPETNTRSRRSPTQRTRLEQRALLVCKEKLEKLRCIRNDNAQMMVNKNFEGEEDKSLLSSISLHHVTHPAYRLPSKPATAPPLGGMPSPFYGTLAYKIYEDDAFAPPTNEKRLLGRPRSLPGREFSFRTDEMGSSDFVAYRPNEVKRCYELASDTANQLFPAERRPWRVSGQRNTGARSRIQSEPVPPNTSPPMSRTFRSGSAPTLFFSGATRSRKLTVSPPKQGTVPNTPRMKRQVGSRVPQRRCNPQIRADRPRTPPSVTTRVSTSRAGSRGWVTFDEGPLGVVGEHFEPCKTRPNTSKFHRPPTDTKVSKPTPAVREITVVPSDSYQAEKESQNDCRGSALNQCHCKSVRFSCSENTVYEYQTSDPIAV
uniref:Uncharacterized protein LOC108950889 n=1 Tax=Phallusia mammillata TaxID=59560 RepID=A0A6F9DK39_9ASCI|nr:uncharacterized protein LOC108950889 [Phallusia mammillata]